MIIKGMLITEAYKLKEIIPEYCKIEIFDDMMELVDVIIDIAGGINIDVKPNHSHVNIKFHTAKGIKSFKLSGTNYISVVIV